jgi:hypothetical protein
MIRPVRYAVLALLVLGILGVGAAVDWSSPSRAPFPAIQLQPAPPLEVGEVLSPKVIQKAKHGGRQVARSPRISVRRDRSPAADRNVPSGPTSSDAADAPASGQAPAATGSDDGGDDRSPGGGNGPSTPTTPNAPPPVPPQDDEDDDPGAAGGAAAAPVPPPEPAGDSDDDDGDDDSGGDNEGEDDDDDDGGEDG